MMATPDDQRTRANSIDRGDDSGQIGSTGEMDRTETSEQLRCSNCGTQVPEGARSCPVCRHGVFRTCFCGRRLPAGQAECPDCGADWSQAKRVTRKSRSRAPKTREALRSALLGSLIALAVAFFLYALASGFAALAVDDTGAVPTSIGERIGFAREGIGRLTARVGAFFARHWQTFLVIAGIMALGAAVGAATYVLQRGRRREQSKRTSRRVHRKRR
ncbi:MAG: hypothetical protein ACOCX2_02880 [Armatimonadota bacterium]